MNTGFTKVIMFALLVVQCMSATAQNVYVTPGDHGPVYSDKPQQGAKAVDLKPLTVIAPISRKDMATGAIDSAKNSAKPPDVIADYRRFVVVSPENNGSIIANTALFEIRLAVEPPLRLGKGHAFAVSINGKPIGQHFTATEFMVPPEFWGDQLPPANQELQLDASIVDVEGNVLQRAAPVRFFMRYAVIRQWPAPHFRSPGRVRPQDFRDDKPLKDQTKEPRKASESKSQLPKMDR